MAQIFDLHIQTLPFEEQIKTSKFMSFGFTSTIGVKGFQLLINMWLKCFLTPKGSDPTDVNYGTEFTFMIGSNIPIKDAQDVVGLSVERCNEQIIAIQRDELNFTNSERLTSATIINFIEGPELPGFDIFVEIQNQASERMTINIPSFATV